MLAVTRPWEPFAGPIDIALQLLDRFRAIRPDSALRLSVRPAPVLLILHVPRHLFAFSQPPFRHHAEDVPSAMLLSLISITTSL